MHAVSYETSCGYWPNWVSPTFNDPLFFSPSHIAYIVCLYSYTHVSVEHNTRKPTVEKSPVKTIISNHESQLRSACFGSFLTGFVTVCIHWWAVCVHIWICTWLCKFSRYLRPLCVSKSKNGHHKHARTVYYCAVCMGGGGTEMHTHTCAQTGYYSK